MMIDNNIKKDLLFVLKSSLESIKENNLSKLREQSFKTVHNSSIYQDEYSVSTSVLIYAIFKVLEKNNYREYKGWDVFHKNLIKDLKIAIDYLNNDKFLDYGKILKKIISNLINLDKKVGDYIENIIQSTKIKKAFNIQRHGLSSGRAAELLGVSKWDLLPYSSQSRDGYESDQISKSLAQKINIAKKIFNIKNEGNNTIVIDTGTIISLATNSLLWVLRDLAKHYKGQFLLPESVKKELIDYPLKTKKFKLEALMINDLILEGYFKVVSSKEVSEVADKLMEIANNMFLVKGNPVKILQRAETEVMALAINMKSDALLVDERTLRCIVENPLEQAKILERRLHSKVNVNKVLVKEFKKYVGRINILRSSEVITVAYGRGLLDRYISVKDKLNPKLREPLLEGALWALKLKGCSISEKEIDAILKIEGLRP